jgi:hypothetical protein
MPVIPASAHHGTTSVAMGCRKSVDARKIYYIFNFFRENATSFRTQQIFQNLAKIRNRSEMFENRSEMFENIVYNVPVSTGARRQHGGSTVAAWTGLNKNLFSRRRWAGGAGLST